MSKPNQNIIGSARSARSAKSTTNDPVAALTAARAGFRPTDDQDWFSKSPEAEGGCGVTGFACTIPVGGKHIYEPSMQMRNRGNGKGGGIAACGLVPEDLGVSRKTLEEDYLLQIALLDPNARGEVEKTFVEPFFNITHGGLIPHVDDYRDVPLIQVKPPEVARYFVRVKPAFIERFAKEKGLKHLTEAQVEDEFVYQNTYNLNQKFYASLGDKRAFVLSHARNLMILKIVGYAEGVAQYYCLENVRAHIWIAHQRYPTRGRVWHPGGCHPFIGMHEALVHNGDFANYHSVCEYLAQRNLFPQFLTDTEASILLFDLMNRTYGYSTEHIIEALAPTSELDFDRLPEAKRQVYRQIQTAHMGGSPDGPWFFIIARNLGKQGFQLLGITDTSMLRPQVFALQQGEVSIGLICSEKQAIDATLASLASEDPRFSPLADRYWNARGGSFTDGGAFLMNVVPSGDRDTRDVRDGRDKDKGVSNGAYELRVTNKFGDPVALPAGKTRCNLSLPIAAVSNTASDEAAIDQAIEKGEAAGLFALWADAAAKMDYNRLRWFAGQMSARTANRAPMLGIEALTLCMDRRYATGDKKRSSVLAILRQELQKIFDAQPEFGEGANNAAAPIRRITWETRDRLRGPAEGEQILLINARGFSAEGPDCDARLAVSAFPLGWRRIIHHNSRGTRFHAAGFGPETDGLRIDCYDNPGDYLGSGMDGLEVHVHCNAQDQLCQIAKRGKLVVHGDVGQTFLYGAKGGDIYVMGNAAGRPMINAVGKPRVLINGTALDFLAESFMAGNPHTGGGFAIINGVRMEDDGRVIPLDLPYPGSNLLSLASGGAIYVRDPHGTLVAEQLNGGAYRPLAQRDWKLILPYLRENERLFGIQVERDLLTVDGVLREPTQVYRKVMPRKDAEIEAEMEGMGE